MKNKILAAILTAFVLLTALQSCNNAADSESETQNIQEDELVEVFEMQEQTDKLVLYRTSGTEQYLTPAINIFKKIYPDVDVEIISIPYTENYEEFIARLNAELAAGQGPDLVFLHTSEVPDIYKMMSAGIFANLNHFIENDSEFNIDDYVKEVLDAGVLRGKRYIMPLQYDAPVLMTTQEILDAEGINPDDLSIFDGFIRAATQYTERYKDNSEFAEIVSGVFIKSKSLFHNWQHNLRDISNLEHFFPWSGIDLIDYQTNTVELDKSKFKNIMDLLKSLYVNKGEEDIGLRGTGIDIPALINQEWLLKIETTSFMSPYSYNLDYALREAKLHEFHTDNISPLYFPYPDTNNGLTAGVSRIAAIPKTSPNQINAFNLLKILLSDKIQNDHIAMYAVPVLKSAIESRMSEGLKVYASDWAEVDYDQLYTQYEQIINERVNILMNIDSAKMIPTIPYYEFLLDEMKPYFEGKRSFDDCYDRLVSKLEIYISE